MNKYKAIITTAGAAKIAAASAGGTQLKIVSMAVGDGNGTLPTPNPAQTALVNEKYRAALNGLAIDKAVKNHILAEMIIPAHRGGFWLREMGLYDEAGTLIAVSNMAESYKPKLAEGSGRTQTLRMILIVSSSEAIQVIAGDDTVLATKDFVAEAIAAHEKTRNHPDASTIAKGLVQLSSATTSTDETKASTPKALKTVSDASMKKAANLSDLPDKAAARGNLALGTAATKNVGVAGGQLMEVGAFGLGSGSRHREDAYCNQGEIYRVNGSSKNAPGGDVYGVLSLPCDGGPSGAYMAVQNNGNAFFGRSNIAENGVTWFQAYTTKFKPTAADVGAWSKKESDGRFVKQSGDTMSGPLALSRVVFPNENTANADTDVNRENGFTVESLVATTNKGYPVPGGMGVLFTGKVNEFRNVQFAVGSGDLAFYLRSLRKDSPASMRWAQVYTTDYKPTAADVGALTDAQAAQKYALRSIKVNGKPLSTDVNLLAGDVNAWNKTEADGRYVKRTGDTMSNTLNLPRVAFPSESAPPVNADDDLTRPNGFTLEQLAAQSKGYPLNEVLGNLLTFKLNRYRNVQFAIGSGNTDFWLRSMRDDNPETARKWAQVYTTDYKPTAADVGALTDTQASQKYALRSIKVNGKPLSADVNLLAGDVNAWNKTEADGRYLAKTGGNITGGVSSSSWVSAAALTSDYHGTGDNTNKAPEGAGAYNNQLGTRAPFYQTDFQWEANSGAIYVPLVKGKSTRKGKGWPTAVSYGYLMPGENMHAHPVIHALGDGVESIWQFNTQTGGIISGKMGEFASQAWVNNGLNGRVDWPSFNQHVGARATIDWVNQNFIQNVRYSAETRVGATGVYTYHDNTVLTGFNNKDGDYSAEELFWSYIQIYKNGQWITVGR